MDCSYFPSSRCSFLFAPNSLFILIEVIQVSSSVSCTIYFTAVMLINHSESYKPAQKERLETLNFNDTSPRETLLKSDGLPKEEEDSCDQNQLSNTDHPSLSEFQHRRDRDDGLGILMKELIGYQKRQDDLRSMEIRIAKEKEESDNGRNRMATDSQMFSALSVVVRTFCSSALYSSQLITPHMQTVFIATLSVAITSLTRDTYSEGSSNSTNSVSNGLLSGGFNYTPTSKDNVYSCMYMSTFVSLLAGCLSGLCAAVRNRMINDTERKIFQIDGPVDRAMSMILIYVSVMLALSVISLIIGLIIFIWTKQSIFVAVAMTVPGAVFVLAMAVGIAIYVT